MKPKRAGRVLITIVTVMKRLAPFLLIAINFYKFMSVRKVEHVKNKLNTISKGSRQAPGVSYCFLYQATTISYVIR